MTDTQVTIKVESGCWEMKNNSNFAELTYQNLLEAGEIDYTTEELEFAKELQNAVNPQCNSEKEGMFTGIAPRDQWKSTPLTASTDGGDVSYIMPMNTFTTACWPVGVAPHTWQACAAVGTSIGERGAMQAARVIAGTAWDLYHNPEIVREIVQEFEENPVKYEPMYEE